MEEQHKSKIVWVLFIIIVALVGLNIYQYYLANNLEVETEVAVVETSATPTTSSTASVSTTPTATADVTANWQSATKSLINSYISSTLPLRTGSSTSHATFDEINNITPLTSAQLQALFSTALKNYKTCIANYVKDPYRTDQYYPGGDYMNGIQAFPDSFSIGDPTKDANNKVTVPVHEMFMNNDNLVNYYLIQENGSWVIDSTSELDKFAATDPHCQK